MHMYSKENRWVDTADRYILNTIPTYTQRFPHCSLLSIATPWLSSHVMYITPPRLTCTYIYLHSLYTYTTSLLIITIPCYIHYFQHTTPHICCARSGSPHNVLHSPSCIVKLVSIPKYRTSCRTSRHFVAVNFLHVVRRAVNIFFFRGVSKNGKRYRYKLTSRDKSKSINDIYNRFQCRTILAG